MPITKERMKAVVGAARVGVDAAKRLRVELARLSAEDPDSLPLRLLLHSSLDESMAVREAELVLREEERWLEKFWNAMERKKRFMLRRRQRIGRQVAGLGEALGLDEEENEG